VGAGDASGPRWETKVSYSGMSSGIWYHIVGTYDKQNVKLYVNGNNVATAPENRTMGNGGGPLCIGNVRYNGVNTHYYNETDAFFRGTIDEVRIYDIALSQNEIALYYSSLSSSSSTPGSNNLIIGECSKNDIPQYFDIHTENAYDSTRPANYTWNDVTYSQVDYDGNGDYELEVDTYPNVTYSGIIFYTYKDRTWTGITQIRIQARMGCQWTFPRQDPLVNVQLIDNTNGNVVGDWHVLSSGSANTWTWGTIDETITGLDSSHVYSVRLYAYDGWSKQKVTCRWEYVNVSLN